MSAKDNSIIRVTEVPLTKHYCFMYETFIVASQNTLYLLLSKDGDTLDALKFRFKVYKCGYPNDEISHPLSRYGLGFYGLFMVENSPWLEEIKNHNLQHPRHSDDLFESYKHYVARFKDITVEVLSKKMEEIQLTRSELKVFVYEQLSYLEE